MWRDWYCFVEQYTHSTPYKLNIFYWLKWVKTAIGIGYLESSALKLLHRLSEKIILRSSHKIVGLGFSNSCFHGNREIITWFWVQLELISASNFFSKANQTSRACRVSAILSLWKMYDSWYIPNCTRKIESLLVNNIHSKKWLWSCLYIVSWLTSSAACLCLVARVVRLFRQEFASNFKTSLENNWAFVFSLC